MKKLYVLVATVFLGMMSAWGYAYADGSPVAQTAENKAPELTSAVQKHRHAVENPVNINTADAQALAAVHGISPKHAAAIVEYRKKHGNFKSVDQLSKVPGFNAHLVKRVHDRVTVG